LRADQSAENLLGGLKSFLKLSQRCDSGACSNARRTSRRTATGPGMKLTALG